MPKFRVVLRRTWTEDATVLVEAEDEADAQNIVKESFDDAVEDFGDGWTEMTLDDESVESVTEEDE